MSAFVFFFGGYLATQSNMDAWLTSAKGQRPNLEFSAFPWPHGAGSGAKSAVTTTVGNSTFGKSLTGRSR